jgi:hypothetical protein
MKTTGLHPINFRIFGELNTKIQNMEATLLFSKIKFDLNYSTINKSGKICIARSRKELGVAFGFSGRKVDCLLQHLENKHYIEKSVGLWYGKKRLFISSDAAVDAVPIHFKSLVSLYKKLGSIKKILVLSRIAFAFQHTKINKAGKKWCALTQHQLSSWSGLSVRTLDNIILYLVKQGLLIKRNFMFNGVRKTHYHLTQIAVDYFSEVNQPVYQVMPARHSKVIHHHNCRLETSKTVLSLNKDKKEKGKNITEQGSTSYMRMSDINFQNIHDQLNARQKKYLMAALDNTCRRHYLTPSNPKELLEEIKYFILNPLQRTGISSFSHAVNRAMKILRDKNWRTPFGFLKYSKAGKNIQQGRVERQQQWEAQKTNEIKQAASIKKLFASQHAASLDATQLRAKQMLSKISRLQALDKVVNQSNSGFYPDQVKDLLSGLYGLLNQGWMENG